MKTLTFTAPAHWASAIINNDNSGLAAGDIAQLALWLDLVRRNGASGDALDCGDEYIGRWNGQLCNVVDYVFPKGGAL